MRSDCPRRGVHAPGVRQETDPQAQSRTRFHQRVRSDGGKTRREDRFFISLIAYAPICAAPAEACCAVTEHRPLDMDFIRRIGSPAHGTAQERELLDSSSRLLFGRVGRCSSDDETTSWWAVAKQKETQSDGGDYGLAIEEWPSLRGSCHRSGSVGPRPRAAEWRGRIALRAVAFAGCRLSGFGCSSEARASQRRVFASRCTADPGTSNRNAHARRERGATTRAQRKTCVSSAAFHYREQFPIPERPSPRGGWTAARSVLFASSGSVSPY